MILGLTGGIGSGKSTVARMILDSHLKFVHVDADVLAKRVMDEKQNKIMMFDQTGAWSNKWTSIDRKALFMAMLDDPILKFQVERVIHGAVKLRTELAIAKTRDNILLDVPLLFESGMDKLCTATLVVSCREDVQIRRVMDRSGYGEEMVRKIIGYQISDADRVAVGNHVVENNGSIEDLENEVRAVLSRIEGQYALGA